MNQYDGEYSRLLNQAPLLAAARDRPTDRSRLQEELDISRATAYRRTTGLVDRNLLEQTPRGYLTTGPGRAVADAVERFERTIEAVDRLEPLLERVTATEFTRHVDYFADADLAVATPDHPNRPTDNWVERFSAADRFRGFVANGCPPVVSQEGAENAGGGFEMELVCTPLALQADRNATDEAFETVVGADGSAIYTHSDLPFTMSIFDDDVLVLVGFDDGTVYPAVTAATDDPEALAWADGLFRRYKSEATAFEPLEADAPA
ncbi:helix-turn-helix transcriptional regulator [Natrarchaeobius sp. A-rgal3]|uniref:helix-turn-helix transcriptional regulator n=1 Tax=Natrarchaeobius versutus TaxID=1679078 RepID=UPI00350F8FE8